MFSEAGIVQEVVALVVAFGALAFVAGKLTGLGPFGRKSKPSQPVALGSRLARGLARAKSSGGVKNAGDRDPAQ
jgi:hypothetical protein